MTQHPNQPAFLSGPSDGDGALPLHGMARCVSPQPRRRIGAMIPAGVDQPAA